MSARSLRRNHARLLEDTRRRNARRAKRASLVAGAALGATVVFAPSALGATYEVNCLSDVAADCDDPGVVCLREAVGTAESTGDDDTVTFASGLSGTIRLSRGQIEMGETGGALTIIDTGTDRVTISGDADPNVGDADDNTRIFGIYGDAQVTLDGLHLTEGYAECDGGAIRIGSDSSPDQEGFHVVIRDSEITGSLAGCGDGGGIAAFADKYSSLEIHSSTISGNRAAGDGGGIYFYGYDKYETNSGDPGTLFVSNSTVSGNEADEGGGIALKIRNDLQSGGGDARASGVLPSGGAVDISNSTVASNTAEEPDGGGGIYLTFNEQKRRGVSIDRGHLRGPERGRSALEHDRRGQRHRRAGRRLPVGCRDGSGVIERPRDRQQFRGPRLQADEQPRRDDPGFDRDRGSGRLQHPRHRSGARHHSPTTAG